MYIIVKKKKNSFAIFMLISVLIFLNVIIIFGLSMFFSIGVSSENLFTICVFLVIPIVLNLYLLNYLFWQIRGYEEIEMTDSSLTVKRRGKLFRDAFTVQLDKIVKIEEQEYETPKFGDFIWQSPTIFSKIVGEIGGKIRLTYSTKALCFKFKATTDFGQELSSEEAHSYVQQMNEILSTAHADL